MSYRYMRMILMFDMPTEQQKNGRRIVSLESFS